jgi:putative hemolysin
MYLDMGAQVCSEPAIDREFGVIDFLIVLDVENLDERTRRRLFGVSPAPSPAAMSSSPAPQATLS